MRYYLDTEFIEDGKTIDPISIGIVCDDGRTYYAINAECDFSKAGAWVLQNVLAPMGLGRGGIHAINPTDPGLSPKERQTLLDSKSKRQIKEDLLAFFAPNSISTTDTVATCATEDDYGKVEIWGYYADYDWVVFCQLFGQMIDLPDGFPMYCRDIKQVCDALGNPELPPQENEHNALEDARWNKQALKFLESLAISGRGE